MLGNKSLFEKFPKLHQFVKLTCVILDADGKEVTADIPIPTSCGKKKNKTLNPFVFVTHSKNDRIIDVFKYPLLHGWS